jgi:hypothetical protein
MAGTPHGLVNARILAATVTANANRNAFAIVAAFFEHLCTAGGGNYCTRIASYWGEGGATGWDRTGGANPAGENAFGVWRLNTSAARPGGGSALGAMYIFVSWADTSLAVNWQLDSSTSTDGCGIVVAFLEDGNSPWNGGIANLGADAIGVPMWTAGGSTLHVLERSCNSGGSDDLNKDNTRHAVRDKAAGTSTDHYIHCIADADNIAILSTATAGSYGSQFAVWMCGLYTMLDIVDPQTAYPAFAMSDNQLPLEMDTNFGATTGGGSLGGGYVTPGSGDSLHRVGYSFTYTGDMTAQPNTYSAGDAVFDESAWQIHQDAGRIGYLDTFFRQAYGMVNEGWDDTNERAAFGVVTIANDKLTLPWPNTIGEAPGATRTEDGVTF